MERCEGAKNSVCVRVCRHVFVVVCPHIFRTGLLVKFAFDPVFCFVLFFYMHNRNITPIKTLLSGAFKVDGIFQKQSQLAARAIVSCQKNKSEAKP